MAPTGEQFEIRSGDVRAVVTEVGAGLRVLTAGGRPLVETFPVDIRHNSKIDRPALGVWAREQP